MEPKVRPDRGPETEKIWNAMFISVFVTNMSLNLAQQMSNSLLAKYADALGAPASQIGMLMSIFALTALLFKVVSAPMMDVYNRKHLVMGAMAIMGVAYVGFALSTSIPSLMVFRMLQGVGNAFGNVCCMALVAQALPKSKFSTGMGYYACAQVVSQAVGPTIGLALADTLGYRVTYFITAAVMLASVVVASRIRLQHKRKGKLKITLHRIIAREALLPGVVILLLTMGFTTINSFLIVYAGKQGVGDGIGLFFTVYAITMLLTRPMVGRLTDRFGLVKIAIPAMCFTVLSFFIISSANRLEVFLLAAFINAFGYGACQPALQSLSMKSVPNSRRGSASSTNYIGMDIGTLIGPTLAGYCIDAFGYGTMWQLMTIPLLMGTVLLFLGRGRVRQIESDFHAQQTQQQAA